MDMYLEDGKWGEESMQKYNIKKKEEREREGMVSSPEKIAI